MSIHEDLMHRDTAVYMLTNVWRLSREEVISLVDSAAQDLCARSQQRLKKSYQEFERIIDTVLTNHEYTKSEQAQFFGIIISELNVVFKGTLNALIADLPRARPNPLDLSKPWNTLKLLFGDKDYGYPAVTTLVTYLRNVDQHKEDSVDSALPTDHITGIETCGNIYTLVSILILSIYAFIEMLHASLEANSTRV